MKPHEPKIRDKRRGENEGRQNIKIEKRRKAKKTLSQKNEKGRKKNFDKKAIKEPKM
jgi:hypothetical protein